MQDNIFKRLWARWKRGTMKARLKVLESRNEGINHFIGEQIKLNDFIRAHHANQQDISNKHRDWWAETTNKLEAEIKNRQAQMKRHQEQVRKKMDDWSDKIDRLVSLEIALTERAQQFDEMLSHSTQLQTNLKNNINEASKVLARIDFIQDIVDKAEKSYYNYLNKLKTDISSYKETDAAVRRLASLESRITLLEKPHGSGETTPRATGTD
jgi:chromosome segregation ATPase